MIEVNDESGFTPAPDAQELAALAAWVFEKMRVHPQADLNIILADEATMSFLHEKWMDLPGATDVLSFPMDELRPAPLGVEPAPGMLGDIVICPAVAAAQARKSGHATMEEILLLATHGILHLLGFDHYEEVERKEMFALQRQLLLSFLARKPQDPNQKPRDISQIDDIAPTID